MRKVPINATHNLPASFRIWPDGAGVSGTLNARGANYQQFGTWVPWHPHEHGRVDERSPRQIEWRRLRSSPQRRVRTTRVLADRSRGRGADNATAFELYRVVPRHPDP